MIEAKCPACAKVIRLQEQTKIHDLTTCPHCRSFLEYVDQYPPTLAWAEDPAVFSSRRTFRKY
jgi:hypothetical protein